MKGNPRAGLLIAAALLMFFAAFGNALVVSDLHGDLIEIGVRPTVLRGTVSALYFAAAAMFIFALMVAQAAMQSMRGTPISRLPLVTIAIVHTVAGAMAFARSHNPHHLGGMLMGALLGAALLIRPSNSGGHP